MKLVKGEDITIFLSNPYIKNLDLDNREMVEKFIYKINKKYNMELYGYYDVNIYLDKNYGIIINIKKEELEYIDYFNTNIEMNIEIMKDSFLYKIEDIYRIKDILNKFIIRKHKDNIYLEKKNISNIDLGIILENAEIIYGKEASIIVNKSEIINPEVITWKNQSLL